MRYPALKGFATYWRPVALIATLLTLFSCAGPGDSLVVVHFSLEAPDESAAADKNIPLRNEQGLFLLESHGVLATLTLKGADMEVPSQAIWPEDASQAASGALDIVLVLDDVPPGKGRTIDATVFLHSPSGPRCFVPGSPTTVDLSPGEQAELDLVMTEVPTSPHDLTALPDEDGAWLVDTDGMVLLDTVSNEAGVFHFPAAPTGRKLTIATLSGSAVSLDFSNTFVLAP